MTFAHTRDVDGEGCHDVDIARPTPLRPASRLWLFLGGLNGLLSVAAGAYARHGALEQAGREMFGIASNYQMAHGLGLLAVAWLVSRHEDGWLTAPNVAGTAFTLGILLFSGSLYWFGLTGLVPVEGSAPTGGFLLMFRLAGGNVDRHPASPVESALEKASGHMAGSLSGRVIADTAKPSGILTRTLLNLIESWL